MDFPAREVADQAELFAALTGIVRPNLEDMFFLVMGKTGSGKSTFIGQCTGKQVTVGHGLYSCTNSIYIADYNWNGRRIFLIDTPGFNDTTRSEVEILGALASSLAASYANGVRIHGVLVLQPMSENRMTGSSLRCIDMVKAVCGFDSSSSSLPSRCKNLAIVTTMWPPSTGNGGEGQRVTLERRYRELCTEETFFGDLLSHGARAFRYNETGSQDPTEQMRAAQEIVAHLVRRSDMHTLEVLQLQREIVIEGKTLGQTTAGRFVANGLDKSQHDYQQRLQQAAQDDEENVISPKLAAQTNAEHLTEIRTLRQELRKVEAEKELLKKSLQDMHKEGWRQSKKDMLDLEKRSQVLINEKNEELVKEVAERQRRLERAARSSPSSRRESKASISSLDDEKDQVVDNLRREVSEARDAHKKFTNYRGNIVNGATNGIAAGITAATLGAAAAAAAAGGTGALVCTVM